MIGIRVDFMSILSQGYSGNSGGTPDHRLSATAAKSDEVLMMPACSASAPPLWTAIAENACRLRGFLALDLAREEAQQAQKSGCFCVVCAFWRQLFVGMLRSSQ
jgi:hypothetical protein